MKETISQAHNYHKLPSIKIWKSNQTEIKINIQEKRVVIE
jgi:hypothetical protein